MPSTNQTTAAEPAATEQPAPRIVLSARAARTLEWFRRGLIVATVIAFMYVAYGYVQLFREWRQAAEPTAAPVGTLLETMPLGGVLPLDGPWTFADLEWNLRSTVVASEQVDARFRRLIDPPTDDFSAYPNASDDLVQLIESLQLRPATRGGCDVYCIDRSTLKAQLLLGKVKGHIKAIAFAGAYPCGNGRWQVFELTPRGAASKTNNEELHLLPLPAGARRQGGRFADDGRLLLELVSLKSNSETVLAEWHSAGWQVRPSGLAPAEGFSYFCHKNNEVVYAWSADAHEHLQHIMLVHSPSDAELKTQHLFPND